MFSACLQFVIKLLITVNNCVKKEVLLNHLAGAFVTPKRSFKMGGRYFSLFCSLAEVMLTPALASQ